MIQNFTKINWKYILFTIYHVHFQERVSKIDLKNPFDEYLNLFSQSLNQSVFFFFLMYVLIFFFETLYSYDKILIIIHDLALIIIPQTIANWIYYFKVELFELWVCVHQRTQWPTKINNSYQLLTNYSKFRLNCCTYPIFRQSVTN